MALESLLKENEASEAAGVTPRTLERFVETGYLQVETSADGSKLYRPSQLASVFGIANLPKKLKLVTSNNDSSSNPNTELEDVIDPLADQLKAPTDAPSKEVDEIDKLWNVIRVQEKLLDARESEITDLRGQRDWLKARIERLEQKAERDQIVLLSETQTIRRLIHLQEPRKGVFQSFLDWLGFPVDQGIAKLPAPTESLPTPKREPIIIKETMNG